jgi:hypothetical protein
MEFRELCDGEWELIGKPMCRPRELYADSAYDSRIRSYKFLPPIKGLDILSISCIATTSLKTYVT